MFDNLRDSVSDSSSPFLEEDIISEEDAFEPETSGQFLGMTAKQRFVIAVLLLMMTCVVSILCLLVTAKIDPFL